MVRRRIDWRSIRRTVANSVLSSYTATGLGGSTPRLASRRAAVFGQLLKVGKVRCIGRRPRETRRQYGRGRVGVALINAECLGREQILQNRRRIALLERVLQLLMAARTFRASAVGGGATRSVTYKI